MIKETAKTITSVQNPKVRHWVKLRESHKYRKERGACLLVGNKLVSEVVPTCSHARLIVLENTKLPHLLKNRSPLFVSLPVLKKITNVPSPEPLCAEVPLPAPTPLKEKKWILALDALGDPGNIGTLARTALALGWEGIFFLPHTVDPFHERVLRASKGALFYLPYFEGSFDELKALCEKEKLTAVVADAQGGAPLQKQKTKENTLLILGSEAKGPTTLSKALAKPLYIPMQKEMESLNVAMAGAIFLYTLGPAL